MDSKKDAEVRRLLVPPMLDRARAFVENEEAMLIVIEHDSIAVDHRSTLAARRLHCRG